MFPILTLQVHPDTLFSLMSHLREAGSDLGIDQAVEQALHDWLKRARAAPAATPADIAEARGYRWKTLFLPEGTRLRVWSHITHPEARVVGDELLCEGCPTSPNRYVEACPGAHRNAWDVISVLLPGHKRWQSAQRLRRNPALEEAPPQPAATQHRWGERRAWNVGGRRETDTMPEPVILDH